jgi:hypothetical protein
MFIVKKGEKTLKVYSQLDLEFMLKNGFVQVEEKKELPITVSVETTEEPKKKLGRPFKRD